MPASKSQMPSAARKAMQTSTRRTMLFTEVVKLAVDSFIASKVRFALTALGMVIGTASLILVVTIGLTGREYILGLLESIGTNMITVDYLGGATASGVTEQDGLTIADMNAVRQQVPQLLAASPILQLHDKVSVGSGQTRDTLILGVSSEYATVRNLKVTAGRFFDSQDELTHAKVAIITPALAKLMFGGSQQAIGKSITVGQLPFTIGGVFKESVDTFGQTEIAEQTILIPYTVGRYFIGTDTVKELFFSVKGMDSVDDSAKQILDVIRSRHRPGSVYTSQTLTELLSTASRVTNALTAVLLLVSSVTLAVSGVGIMNIMLANVRSRIREIGIRKAVGATAREIQLQFMTEAVLISTVGGAVGIVVGLSIPFTIRVLTGYDIPVSGLSVLIAIGAAALVGVAFGTLPAIRASQLDPTESLKFE